MVPLGCPAYSQNTLPESRYYGMRYVGLDKGEVM